MATVLVTPRSITRAGGHPSLDRLTEAGHEVVFCAAGRQPTEDELMELLPGCAAYLAGVEPVTAKILNAVPELKVISRNGTGIDNVDLDAAEKNGVKVARAAGANARGVAELTVSLLFALARSIPFSDAAMKQGQWERRKGIELQGKTLGLVGCGVIGKMVAEMACAVGMEVLAYDVYESPDFAPPGAFAYAPLDKILARADFLSLHCPAREDGSALIDRDALERMKPGVYIINTARASLLNDADILEALDNGQVAGLATDVFDPEPPVDTTLAGHSRVIATPHIGGFTNESVDRAMQVAVENILVELGG